MVGLCTLTAFGTRAFGPAAVTRVPLSPRLLRVLSLLPAALLAALVATNTIVSDAAVQVGPRAGGVAFAGVLIWRRASIITIVVGAAAMAALLRLVT
ncbi:AzlD domain-containing protein [Baekduia soli]|uniref:AzlD domain-containing protein n=1 Tax=Baekduia soli TaxID=496014 RepID=A0A5B8UCV9_9ACTN|nr:AzlD domain-containing protein [Baekduia soli]